MTHRERLLKIARGDKPLPGPDNRRTRSCLQCQNLHLPFPTAPSGDCTLSFPWTLSPLIYFPFGVRVSLLHSVQPLNAPTGSLEDSISKSFCRVRLAQWPPPRMGLMQLVGGGGHLASLYGAVRCVTVSIALK
jgi:hypothetical protein